MAENPPGPVLAEKGPAMLRAHNRFNGQLEKAELSSFPAPPPLELARLTKQVARNNHFYRPGTDAQSELLFSFLRGHIHHVIYIIKENRTYDQILGDLQIGNGDSQLTIFPERLTSNHHSIVREFVMLDNFLVRREGRWSGWDWSTATRANDFREFQYAAPHGALAGSFWGANRHANMGYATNAQRHAESPDSPSDPEFCRAHAMWAVWTAPVGAKDTATSGMQRFEGASPSVTTDSSAC